MSKSNPLSGSSDHNAGLRMLSPPVSRVLAITLLLFALYALMLLLIHAWEQLMQARDRLDQSRFAAARLNSVKMQVSELDVGRVTQDGALLTSVAITAANAAQAAQQAEALLRQLCASQNLAVPALQIMPVHGNRLNGSIVVDGPESAVLQLLAQLESGSPMIGIDDLTVATLDASKRTIRMTAEFEALWLPPGSLASAASSGMLR
jgi:Type II secretion system (T2SS), protein M subtype b